MYTSLVRGRAHFGLAFPFSSLTLTHHSDKSHFNVGTPEQVFGAPLTTVDKRHRQMILSACMMLA